ncbi:BgTH12-04707 [Blumeria graminis f. sp. triticale]|uniref:Bgt-51120 n=2 Tax=Blumeria graminis TaxID=34373 RepID=A0A9X9L865_BLUGR|nr:BgTH12-04707 [Blumeria graminis f. sp. triticale]VCU39193.1 Bgt-51120 [Blumeria graminis f. sp. tritici]
MKFLSATTTAAFASLLLLVPTAYGNGQFRCPRGDPFTMTRILEMAQQASIDDNLPSNPAIPTGESCTSYCFSGPSRNDGTETYGHLLQVYGQPPKYQFSQHVGGKWELCTFENVS